MGRKKIWLLPPPIVLVLLIVVACGDQTATPRPIADATVVACLPVVGCVVNQTPTPPPSPRPTDSVIPTTSLPAIPAPVTSFTPQPYTCLMPGVQGCNSIELPPTATPRSLLGPNVLTAASFYYPPTSPPPPTSTPTRKTPPVEVVVPTPINQQLMERTEREVSFSSNGLTVFGTYLRPESVNGKAPAVLLLAGGGALDRNGNSSAFPGQINTQLNFARELGSAGYISLRYDKLGAGKTGLGSFAANPTGITFNLYLEEAKAAYEFLRLQPDVDPTRITILGYDEGGLLAMLLAEQLPAEIGPKALALAAPISRPYLETIRIQLAEQYIQAQLKGLITKEQLEASNAEIERLIKVVRESGKVPTDIALPELRNIFNPLNEKFLLELAQVDPLKLSEKITTKPVLLLCGQKDIQIFCGDVKSLAQSFERAGNSKVTFVELENVIHVFKEVSGETQGVADYYNPAYKFSQTAKDKLIEFVKANL